MNMGSNIKNNVEPVAWPAIENPARLLVIAVFDLLA
jgi:hypothetical protein